MARKGNDAGRAPFPIDYCPTGKRAYRTKAYARAYYRAHLHDRGTMRAYRCPTCGAYHLTSMSYAGQARTGSVCPSSTTYADVGAAMRAADTLQRTTGTAYGFTACDVCGGYHVAQRRHDGLPIVVL